MPYLVHTENDREEMLAALGVESMDDLLIDIPSSLRLPKLNLPDGLSEFETMSQVRALAARNRIYPDRLTFRGGGVYRRFIPTAGARLPRPAEFYTTPTPHPPQARPGHPRGAP